MNNLTCVLFPDMVRLLIAQAASFWVWNSPLMFHNQWWTKMALLGEQGWVGKVNFVNKDGFQEANSPGQMGDDHGHKPVFNHCLHLLLVSCCYVGQEPHRLLQVEWIWNLDFEKKQLPCWSSPCCGWEGLGSAPVLPEVFENSQTLIENGKQSAFSRN